MLRVPVDHICPGMVLARPVALPSDPYRYLLQRDREIPADLVPRLRALGITEVWVRHRQLEFLEALIDEDLSERQREVYWQLRRNFEAVMTGTSAQLDFSAFVTSISGLFGYLKESHAGNVLLQKLDAFDNYLLSHSTNVCYLSLLLGMRLERYLIEERGCLPPSEAKDLRELGLGCLLHDVGKIHIPAEILNKPGRLNLEEMHIMQRHPVQGYEMVRGNVSAMAAQVVLNHHQRFAGGGYPRRTDARTGEPLPEMVGRQIPIFSRMATICDVFDAATTHRVYSAAKPPVQALFEMRAYCRGFFDPVVERAFYEVIPPFPIGQMVTLSNGMEAVVVDFNPEHPIRPKVQPLKTPSGQTIADPSQEEIDLAVFTDLMVTHAADKDIRPYVDIQVKPPSAMAAV